MSLIDEFRIKYIRDQCLRFKRGNRPDPLTRKNERTIRNPFATNVYCVNQTTFLKMHTIAVVGRKVVSCFKCIESNSNIAFKRNPMNDYYRKVSSALQWLHMISFYSSSFHRLTNAADTMTYNNTFSRCKARPSL